MTKLKPTLLESLDEMSPKLTRFIARRGWRKPFTNEEIAKASGLTAKRVSRISCLETWASLTVSEVDAFRSACGVTPLNIKWHRAYLRRALNGNTKQPLAHLDERKARTKFFSKLLKDKTK